MASYTLQEEDRKSWIWACTSNCHLEWRMKRSLIQSKFNSNLQQHLPSSNTSWLEKRWGHITDKTCSWKQVSRQTRALGDERKRKDCLYNYKITTLKGYTAMILQPIIVKTCTGSFKIPIPIISHSGNHYLWVLTWEIGLPIKQTRSFLQLSWILFHCKLRALLATPRFSLSFGIKVLQRDVYSDKAVQILV